MTRGNILIIDDEEKLRGLLARILGLEGYGIFEAGDARAGLKLLEKEEIQLVLSDVKLPDANGVDLTAKIKQLYPTLEVVVITAYGTIQDGVKAIKNGAFDYITKGDENDRIIPTVSRAIEKAALQQKVQQLEQKVIQKYGFDNILGSSKQITAAKDLARKVAGTEATVLLTGETGTGKEVFAQAIHYASNRRGKSFVAVNCSALGKDILESELFGYRAGAFTGAAKDRKGLFEEAHEGTIFLDEIGEMNLDLQAKLLRVLETGTFIKVGDTKETKVNVRIIAATNRDLQKESDKGSFRLDLFYRLSVFSIELPPLRDRKEDIELLTQFFVNHFSQKNINKTKGVDKHFLEALKAHYWKGNIRELRNIIERAVILNDGEELTVETLPFDFNRDTAIDSFDLALVEKTHILKVIKHTKGNKTEAAQLLNIGLTTLYRKLEEYKLS